MLAFRARPLPFIPLLARRYATPVKKKKKFDPNALPLAEAIAVIKALEAGRPSKVQLSILFNMEEGKKSKMHSTVALPTPVSRNEKKKRRLLVFAQEEKAEEARVAGAQIVGGMELIDQIKNGEVVFGRSIKTQEGKLLEFDKVISTVAMFPSVITVARILASIQQMPQAKRGTVTDDIQKAVAFQMWNSCDLFSDEVGNMPAVVGLIDFSFEDIKANVGAVLDEVRAYGEANNIKRIISKVFVHAGHSPAIPVSDVADLKTVEKI